MIYKFYLFRNLQYFCLKFWFINSASLEICNIILQYFWGCAASDGMSENEENCLNLTLRNNFNLQWRNRWWQCLQYVIPDTGLLSELNLNRRSISIVGRKIKCCQDKKGVYCYYPTSAILSLKPIHNPFVPIKPHEDSDHLHVITWTLKWKRWIPTTETLITTEILQFPIEDQPKQFLILNDVFPEFCLRLIDQIVRQLNQILSHN